MCFDRDMSLRDDKRIYIILNANEMSIYRRRRLYRILPTAKYIEKGNKIMAECKNDMREMSIEFAIAVSDACDEIKGLSPFTNQLLRSSSSIGANIHEAKYAQSRADFISKLEIALKESSETEYWLELIYRKKKLTDEQYRTLKNTCGTLRRKLIASVTTAKNK